jgi:flagella basal body P-ring formation protein FlgA
MGIARQSGRIGDEVRVRVEPTGAMITARVIDVATVEVRP